MSGREFSDTEWKEEAKKQQNFFYHSYENQMFQAYNPQEDRLLLRAKVNFSSFGKPQKEAERIEEAYDDQQNSASEPIVKHIYETYDKIGGSGKELCVSILFILCYKNKNIFRQPLYAVKGDGDTVHYIDTMGRRYKSWTDFKNCNRWKEMDICIPLNGYYSCSTDGFQYDEKSDVQLEFTITPAKRGSHKLVDIADGTAAVVGLGAGVIGIASLLTPVGWGVGAVAAYASIGGMGAASYGFVRSSYQIIDKALHDGDMLSLDSFVLYGTLALTPLNFASSFATGRLAQHAASGSIGSKGLRTIVTILNVTTLTLDGTMIVFNVANLVEKYKKDELTALDVVQFSMSVFFFTHTLIQPTTATQVIKQTQTERFETYSQNLSEGDARATFKRFVENNGGDIRKDSHTIRTINRMDNPDSFFKSNKDATIKLGGRKGKTVLVTDSNGVTNRINPNRVFQTEGYKPFVLVSQDRRRIESALGEDIESFEVDSNKIFQNASEHELRNLKETINSKNASPEIVNAAKELCQDLKEHTSGGFISMVEIVAAHVKEGNTTELLSDLLGPGRADFLAGLKADITEATRLANNAELSFKSALQAVYHFRKHGEDFLCKIPTIECYLNITPEMYKDAHLIRIHNMQDGRYRKTYLKPNDTLMVVDETRGGASLVTIFNKSGGWLKYLKDLANNASIPDNTTLWDFIIGQFKLFKVTPRFFVFNDQQASTHSDDTLDDCFVDFLKSMSVDDVDFD